MIHDANFMALCVWGVAGKQVPALCKRTCLDAHVQKMTRKKTVARRRKKLQASSGGEAPALVRSSSSASAGGTQPQEVLSLRDAETIRLCKQALEAEVCSCFPMPHRHAWAQTAC